MSAILECRGVSVHYGNVRAVNRLDLTVDQGETVALLGPSGSGKSTLAYAVAGFVPLSDGEILMGGERVAGPDRVTAPEERGVAVVFQNYALWPHMDAVDTVAYPIRRAGAPRRAARREALAIMERLGIGDLARRRPSELSGGQQQRVGLARALARRAGLYLFDEPTAHLDASIRTVVQAEIARTRRHLGAAAIYSTHDATEALAIADRVALLRRGSIIQLGTPRDVYENPVDRWAAALTGPVSVVAGQSEDGVVTVDDVLVDVSARRPTDGPVEVLVRPDWLAPGGQLKGTVTDVLFRGYSTDYVVDTAAGVLVARLPGAPSMAVGDRSGWSIARGAVTTAAAPEGRSSGSG